MIYYILYIYYLDIYLNISIIYVLYIIDRYNIYIYYLIIKCIWKIEVTRNGKVILRERKNKKSSNFKTFSVTTVIKKTNTGKVQ